MQKPELRIAEPLRGRVLCFFERIATKAERQEEFLDADFADFTDFLKRRRRKERREKKLEDRMIGAS